MPGIAERCSARIMSTYRPLRSVTTWSCRYFAVSRPRRNDSSVLRKRALLPQPVADAAERRARVVDHHARRIDLAPDVGNLGLERGDGLDQAVENRERARQL